MSKTKKLVLIALFIAIGVLLKSLTTIYPQFTKFSLVFVPCVTGASLLGPIPGAIIGALTDVISYLIRMDGPYYPGFTLSDLLKGLIYGLFLFKKPKTILNITPAILTVIIFIDFLINSFWINNLFGMPLKAAFVSKLATLPIYAAIQISVMYLLFKYLEKPISKYFE